MIAVTKFIMEATAAILLYRKYKYYMPDFHYYGQCFAIKFYLYLALF